MEQQASQLRFDRVAWRRLFALAKPFFTSEIRWLARGLLVLLALFSVSVSALNVLMSYISRDFMTALSLKEKDEFLKQLYLYLLAFAGVSPVVVFYRYTEERFGLLWRRWLSLRMLNQYFSQRAYYKINSYEGIDNPDQRIEEDIRSFCVTSLSLLLILFNSIITISLFMGILWSISFTLTVAVLLYALFGSLLAYLLGRPLIGLNFNQLRKEANYRYKLVNVRDNAESIAFYRAEAKERTRTRQRLKEALRNLLLIIKRNRNLNFFTTNYNFIIGILPTIIVAPLYLDGKIEFGVILQAGTAFVQVVNALSIIVLNFGQLSALTAVITRLGSFWEALESVAEGDTNRPGITTVVNPRLEFKSVTIMTPKRDQVLLRDLSFSLDDKRLLITGTSGSGKSSILRVIAGIWSSGSGEITRPNLSECMFLPQRTYMVLGTFRNQLLYGQPQRGIPDSTLLAIVSQVGLGDTLRRIGGFDGVFDWPNFLSTGEQQRLAFARLILAQPKFAFLDEATTALDARSETAMYRLLQSFTRSFVTIGYRGALEQFHDYLLELGGDGAWKIEPLEPKEAP